MEIKYWWVGVVSYLVVHGLHIAIWRFREMKHDVRALFILFLGVPGLIYGLACCGQPGIWAALAMHLALSANYIAMYPAFQASSPTLEILYRLYYSPNGKTESEILNFLGSSAMITERISDLERSRLAYSKDGELHLTWFGNVLAQFFMSYRRILGLTKGEG